MNCRYYTEQTLGWMLNNKLIVFLSLLWFCLFVSTLALSGQKGRLQDEVEELKAAMTTEAPTEAPNNTTEAPTNPDETVPETNTEGTNPEQTETNPDNTVPETNPETNPDETAPETNPETNPNETAPETNPETNPNETAPETSPDNGTETDTNTGDNNTDNNGPDGAIPAKSETVESTNEENVNTLENLKDIVKESKLLSLIAA